MLFSKRMIVLIRLILQDIDIRYKMSIVRLVINIDGVAYVEFLYTFFFFCRFQASAMRPPLWGPYTATRRYEQHPQ